MARGRPRIEMTLERALSTTVRNEATGCLLWRSGPMHGYGACSLNGEQHLAHRAVWFMTYGRWPVPMCLHRCDRLYPLGDITNRRCVNVEHLYEGNAADNSKDRSARAARFYKPSTFASQKLQEIGTQEAIAAVSRWLSGIRLPSARLMVMMSERFGIKMDWWFRPATKRAG